MPVFRRPFHDLIDRQLTLFAADHRDEITTLVQLLDAQRVASREDATESFGDYQDQIDWLADDLFALRDAYSATLPEETAASYRRAFGRAARRRLPALTGAIRSDADAEGDGA
jgi:hypothetical protein